MNHAVAFLENWSIRQSPSGFTDEVIVLVEKEAAVFGAGWITEDIEEFIAVDMGALGAAPRSCLLYTSRCV